MSSNQQYENMYECENCGNVWDGNAQCECGMLETTNEDGDQEYECENCGNVWDGNAQCICGMLDNTNEDGDQIVFDSDSEHGSASDASDASDMLSDFEDSGHIPTDTTREDIQKMIVVARSQEKTDEVPEWMDETRDYLTNGLFIDGKYHISSYVISSDFADPSFKEMVLSMYPTLTDEECDQFSEQSKAGMHVSDIVDGFNIKRMRDYETARVLSLHWPQWVDEDVSSPTLTLVKMRCE